MPWKIVRKTYGRDPRVDAVYHIQYQSSTLTFDIICSYLNESYRWILNSNQLGVKAIVLGESPRMTDKDAGLAAVTYLKKFLTEQVDDLDRAKETIETLKVQQVR